MIGDKMKKSNSDVKTDANKVDLTKKSIVELNELLDRQNKIISNGKFLNNLPDKGERIKIFHSKILEEIKNRDVMSGTADMFSRLKLGGLPNEIEWSGKKAMDVREPIDSDDDSEDDYNPLKLVANHSGTQKSLVKKEQLVEPSLFTSKDIAEANHLSYAQQMCQKIDPKVAPERFKPNQSKNRDLEKTGYKSSTENVVKKLGKNWEVTAATPPVPLHGSTEMVSLAESLVLQEAQAAKLKEIQLHEATMRLQASSSRGSVSSLPRTNLMNYRKPVDPTQIFEETPIRQSGINEDQLEDYEVESGGAVFYNIVDDVPEKS